MRSCGVTSAGKRGARLPAKTDWIGSAEMRRRVSDELAAQQTSTRRFRREVADRFGVLPNFFLFR